MPIFDKLFSSNHTTIPVSTLICQELHSYHSILSSGKLLKSVNSGFCSRLIKKVAPNILKHKHQFYTSEVLVKVKIITYSLTGEMFFSVSLAFWGRESWIFNSLLHLSYFQVQIWEKNKRFNGQWRKSQSSNNFILIKFPPHLVNWKTDT